MKSIIFILTTLVIDQPEDDLDPYYVWKIIVSQLINLKSKRQFIFVTHAGNHDWEREFRDIIPGLLSRGNLIATISSKDTPDTKLFKNHPNVLLVKQVAESNHASFQVNVPFRFLYLFSPFIHDAVIEIAAFKPLYLQIKVARVIQILETVSNGLPCCS